MKILVTGAAGFIGMHMSTALCQQGHQVIGIDDLNDYYPASLKQQRLVQLQSHAGFSFQHLDIAEPDALSQLMACHRPDVVIHLAAQPGVRYSQENPLAYTRSNLIGFTELLEACRLYPVRHLIFASTSSVYGSNLTVPLHESEATDAPLSFYAATKKANEVMAYSYAHLYGIPMTGLRFFTVYGPWGRPDMAPWLFTDAILHNRPIKVFGHGKLQRDFTYVSDIVESMSRLIHLPPDASQGDPYRVFNIGNHQPVAIPDFIATLERVLGKSAITESVDMQPGDVPSTCADCTALTAVTGFCPSVQLEDGLSRFVAWYRDYHGV
ncbi:NAD-dependent epimerase/dehydratase family protein [Burkholderiaceae bacterium DAT-1]|nr:NAD-dependent epimerase/dehydratase family protein [Burkholderiaceae bacterium DAT-1]